MIKVPGVIKPGTIVNDIGSHEDMLPTLLAAAGDTNVTEDLKKAAKWAAWPTKVHLDGYNLNGGAEGRKRNGHAGSFIY